MEEVSRQEVKSTETLDAAEQSGPSTAKTDIPCPCGDEAHMNLEEWYKDYVQSSAENIVLFKDKFNKTSFEEKIEKLLPQVPVSSDYCTRCQDVLDKWPEIIKKVPECRLDPFGEPYQQQHFKDTFEFEAAYRNGCQLCTMFVQCSIDRGHSLEEWHRLQNRLNCLGKSTAILISVRSRNGYYVLTLTWPGLVNYVWLPADPLYCIANYGKTPELFTLGKEVCPLAANGFLSQLDLAKKWLDVCSETHESCKSTQDRLLPTRLIDLGITPIRLVLTSTFTIKPRYATLSHCWGTQDFLKLQEDSLEQFMVAIPEDKLTKTFRDAIHITRSLGLRYLWIDALCIIQLSNPDWRNESAHMSSVYGGSTINIAATGASDGTKGCFLNLPGFVSKVRFESTKNEVWDIAPGAFYHSVATSQLAGRAWALQERLLSSRTLHFSKTELFWECRHCDASESFPEGLPDFQQQHIFHRDRKPLSEIWHTIVRMYTAGKLTFGRDKLVAISGIAQQVQEENQDQYLAGLWRKDIELQLLWLQTSSAKRLPKGSEYRAPSWSWASVDERGFVYYTPKQEGSGYVYHAHVIDAHVVPAGEEPFGELVGGVLKMSCSVMIAGKLRKVKGTEWNGKVWDYNEVDIENPNGKKESFAMHPDSDEYDGGDIYILPVVEVSAKNVLPVVEVSGKKYENENEKYDKRDILGLLLLPTGNKKGEYTRAGVFNLMGSNKRQREEQERFFELLEISGQRTAEAQCAEILPEPEFPNERYAITII